MKFILIEWIIRNWLIYIKGIKVGSRYIVHRSGFNNSGKDCHINIGEITSFSFERMTKDQWEFGVNMNLWGYDLKEEDYVFDSYTRWMGSLKQFLELHKCQSHFRRHFSKVDLSKNPGDFYESQNFLEEIKNIN